MTTSNTALAERPAALLERRGFTIDTAELAAWRNRVQDASSFSHRHNATSPLAHPKVAAPKHERQSSILSDHRSEGSGSRHSPGGSRRPSLFRASISQQMHDAPLPSPLVGVGLDPARTDYFEQASAARTSFRPIAYLSCVVAGRVLIAMGLGGVSVGFVPMQPTAPGLARVSMPPGSFGAGSQVALSLSIAAIVAGVGLAAGGLGAFCLDTYALNPRRAYFMGCVALTGVAGVTAGGVAYIYGQDQDSLAVRAVSLLPRTIGNFGVFYALPNSFAACEIVHGNAPIPNREQTRQISFALGVALLILYGYINAPGINAPQIAKELILCAGIAGACIGSSMARTNNLRLASERRQLRSPHPERRRSSLLRSVPMRSV